MSEKKVVALVPCKDGESSIAATVTALSGEPFVSEIVVIDDGSKDDTAIAAFNAGARVIRLERNQGKGAALSAGVEAANDADVYLLVDADTESSAVSAVHLLPPVFDGASEMTVGVLPSAGTSGGFGVVKDFAAWGIARACDFQAKAPLSGQRAIQGDLLRSLVADPGLASRFGVEVGLTIDAINRGARVVEVDVDMTHDHRGRTIGGFVHRGFQGLDIARALWYRSLPLWMRLVPLAIVTVMVLLVCVLLSSNNNEAGKPLPNVEAVSIVLVPGGSWDSVDQDVAEQPRASVVTGDVDDVFQVVRAGSRAKDAPAADDIAVTSATEFQAADEPTIVAGITVSQGTDAATTAQLRPLAIYGIGKGGAVTSPSTDRAGLVDITDLAPTVLAMEGKPIPSTMTGEPIRFAVNDKSAVSLATFASLARFYEDLRPSVIWVFALIQVVAYSWALLAASNSRQVPYSSYVATSIAAFPLATYLTLWIFGVDSPGVPAWWVVCLVCVAALVTLCHFGGNGNELKRILLATVVFICVDVLAGAHLQLSGIFGSSPLLGARYHGLGNPATELLMLAALLWTGLHVGYAKHRGDAWWSAAALLLVATVVIGAPGLGSDVGGLFAMSVTSAGLLVALRLGRLSWRWLISFAAAGIGVICVAAGLDYQRAADQRTHLGRLVARMVDEGISPLVDTVGRKVDANLLSYGFPWSLVVVAICGYVLFRLIKGAWSDTFPLKTPQRAALFAALVGSFIGYAVNDSGIVVLALVAVFVGPYVLAEYRRRRSWSKLEVGS